MFVLTVGNGVAGFTLHSDLGEFVLTHADVQVPPDTQDFAINSSTSRFREAPVKRYVDECLAGRSGPRGKDVDMRWIASLAAAAHRILMRGGVSLYPRDSKDPSRHGRLRLLYEAEIAGDGHFSHFGPETNLFAEREALFDRCGRSGTGRTRKDLHDAEEAAPACRSRARSHHGPTCRPIPTCCSTKACRARSSRAT